MLSISFSMMWIAERTASLQGTPNFPYSIINYKCLFASQRIRGKPQPGIYVVLSSTTSGNQTESRVNDKGQTGGARPFKTLQTKCVEYYTVWDWKWLTELVFTDNRMRLMCSYFLVWISSLCECSHSNS